MRVRKSFAPSGPPTMSSPLEGRESPNRAVSLAERTGLGALCLRGSGEEFLAAVAKGLGLPLPTVPNTTCRSSDLLALWVGPDEWLVRVPESGTEACAAALRGALTGSHAAVVDVSHRACVLRVSGVYAREVLAHGCPLDLHPRVFRPGDCAQSHYLDTAILIHQVDAIPTYDLETPNSYAAYLWDLLVEASREHDGP